MRKKKGKKIPTELVRKKKEVKLRCARLGGPLLRGRLGSKGETQVRGLPLMEDREGGQLPALRASFETKKGTFRRSLGGDFREKHNPE